MMVWLGRLVARPHATLRSSRLDRDLDDESPRVHDALKDSRRGASAGPSRGRVRATLVVAQVAFACVLLIGAALLVRILVRVTSVDIGFRPDHAVAIRIEPRDLEGEAQGA